MGCSDNLYEFHHNNADSVATSHSWNFYIVTAALINFLGPDNIYRGDHYKISLAKIFTTDSALRILKTF